MEQKVRLILFIFIVTISLLARTIVVTTRESFYSGDQAFFYFITRSIVVEHKIPLIGSYVGNLGGFAQSAGWNYFLAIPFIFTNGDPNGFIGFMFVISILTVVTGSFMSWYFFGKKESIYISFFLGISPYLINYSNRVLPPYIIPLFCVIYFAFLLLFLKKSKKKYFFFLTITLGFMFLIEIASFGLLLPSFILLAIYFIYQRQLKVTDLIKAVFILAIFFIPHIFYDIFHNFYNIRGVVVNLPLHKATFIGSNFFANVADRIHLFKDDIIFVFPTLPIKVIIFFFLFLIWGAFLYIKNKNIERWKKIFVMYLIGTIFLTFVLLLLVPTRHADVWWLTFLTVFYLYFGGIISNYIFTQKGFLYKVIIFFFFLLLIKSSTDNFSSLLRNKSERESIKYPTKIQEPIEYVYSDSHNKPFNVFYITGNPEVLDYKYLFWYFGTTKYKKSEAIKNLDLRYTTSGGYRFPLREIEQFDSKKKGLYYLIITNESIRDGYAAKLLRKRAYGKLITKKSLGNFEVQKILVE